LISKVFVFGEGVAQIGDSIEAMGMGVALFRVLEGQKVSTEAVIFCRLHRRFLDSASCAPGFMGRFESV
jgi:hypothetical protein